jgi:vancomycin resistance protein VanW
VWLGDEHLKGLIACNTELQESFHIVEKNHRFVRQNEKNYRQNEIWRRVVDRRSGNLKREELLVSNFALVKYSLPDQNDDFFAARQHHWLFGAGKTTLGRDLARHLDIPP